MVNPIEKLKVNISGMTEAQRKVADYIIKNSLEVAFMTIDQLAGVVGTSTTTIMRLMAHSDYSGYTEFQKGLRELLRNKVNPKTRLEVNLKEMSGSDLWTQCYEKQMNNIHDTFAMLSKERLDETIRRIIDARQVYFTCARGGLPVAQYLTSFFNRMFGNCRLLKADMLTDWLDVLLDMNSSDLIVAISYPRYATRLVNLVKLAKDNDTQIISLTDGYSSPLAEFSDFILPCSCSSLGFHNSPVSTMVVADCLINVVAIRYPKLVEERLDKANNIATDLEYYTL